MSVLSILVGVQVRRRLRARRHRAGPPARLSDAQVLEARTLHERYGFGTAALLRHYKITVTDNSRRWMSGILNYAYRSSPTKPLDPKIQQGRG